MQIPKHKFNVDDILVPKNGYKKVKILDILYSLKDSKWYYEVSVRLEVNEAKMISMTYMEENFKVFDAGDK